jgi:uncharacterized protein YutE (UPF0331/DUF86 family)
VVDRPRLDQLLTLLARYVTILRELAMILGREGVLEPELAADLQPMARMRNRLVRHYQDVSAAQVHEILGTRLGDFDRFAEQLVAYADHL